MWLHRVMDTSELNRTRSVSVGQFLPPAGSSAASMPRSTHRSSSCRAAFTAPPRLDAELPPVRVTFPDGVTIVTPGTVRVGDRVTVEPSTATGGPLANVMQAMAIALASEAGG
jgi:hypothetical protein